MTGDDFNETTCPRCGPSVGDQGTGYGHRADCPLLYPLLNIRVTITDREAIAALSHERLRTYLDVHGWRDVGAVRFGRQFILNDRGAPSILCPTTREIGDYVSRMADAVTTLARVENRSELLVYADLIGE